MTSISGGGGSFPSAQAGADAVLALLRVLADPQLHTQRLQELISAETSAQATQTAALETQKVAVELHQATMEREAAVTQAEKVLAERQRLHDEMRASFTADIERQKAELAKAQNEHSAAVAKVAAQHETQAKELNEWAHNLDAREAAARQRETLATRSEQRVAAKLKKLKEFEEA